MIEIKIDDLKGPEIAALLQRHLDHMRSISPADSVFALDIERLRVPEITFWTAWRAEELLGCVALKDHGDGLGEIKSMHTREQLRGQGIARQLLSHLINEAQRRSLKRLSLETGATEHFTAAQRLYTAFGFEETGPFADYKLNPHSYFMTKQLSQ